MVKSQFPEEVSIDKRFKAVLWNPAKFEIVPKRVALLPFGVWWVMHYLHLFSNQDYGLYLIYDGNNLIHRSVITPRYIRFPFMTREDLQIGDTWTMSDYRRNGLAHFAIQRIFELYKKNNRRFWYVVEEDNKPSIRVAEKAGFKIDGAGYRRKRMGMNVLGSFEMENPS